MYDSSFISDCLCCTQNTSLIKQTGSLLHQMSISFFAYRNDFFKVTILMILTYIKVIPIAFLNSFMFLISLFPSLCPATVNISIYSHKPTISEKWMASMEPILQVRKLTQREEMDSSSVSQCVSEADLVEMFPEPWFTGLFTKYCCPPHRFKNSAFNFLNSLRANIRRFWEKSVTECF